MRGPRRREAPRQPPVGRSMPPLEDPLLEGMPPSLSGPSGEHTYSGAGGQSTHVPLRTQEPLQQSVSCVQAS